MSYPPPQPHTDDDDDDDPTGNFYFGIGMVIFGVLLAIAPHTSIWTDQITPDATGRRSGMTRLLASIDPMLITGFAAVIAVIGAVLAVSAFRKGRRLAAQDEAAIGHR